ncbi:MAG: phosphopantothenate/pantothenate synthetase [Caldisphaeraceae archaeon]|nr:phosphopantothenate/pantothenate synthetase [Caldisphaeraceae archaeon]
MESLNKEEIPKSHPRYQSLVTRERIVSFFKKGIVVSQGLVAQGRGEAFDYILGEKSHEFAIEAEKVTIAYLLLSKKPIISVNGNYVALAGEEIVKLSNMINVPIEVNLFHRTEDRIDKIEKYLRSIGAEKVFGEGCKKVYLPNLNSLRGIVCEEGIFSADFVLLAIEDGDRTQALKELGKKVAAIDLNPFSRTAQAADISIIDDAIRATKNMLNFLMELRQKDVYDLKSIISSYDNRDVLAKAFRKMLKNLESASTKYI